MKRKAYRYQCVRKHAESNRKTKRVGTTQSGAIPSHFIPLQTDMWSQIRVGSSHSGGGGGRCRLRARGWGFWEAQCSSDRTSAPILHMHAHSQWRPCSFCQCCSPTTHNHTSTQSSLPPNIFCHFTYICIYIFRPQPNICRLSNTHTCRCGFKKA